VADNRGGTNACVVPVIVVDTTPPLLTCPGNIVTQAVAGAGSVVVNFSPPSASDNCGAVSVVSSPPSGSAFAVGTNVVTSVATDSAGNTNVCQWLVIVRPADTVVRDLALLRVKGPKAVKLSEKTPTVARPVKVTIQNRGQEVETITDPSAVVQLVAQALALCPDRSGTLLTEGPIVLAPGQKRTVVFALSFDALCVPDARRSTRTERYDDYRLVASVHRSLLDDLPDARPDNDQCPRAPAGMDAGCAPVVVDVYVWFW
jgi:hypothetical protein